MRGKPNLVQLVEVKDGLQLRPGTIEDREHQGRGVVTALSLMGERDVGRAETPLCDRERRMH